jgi:transcriptional regulator with XRE-family HTH domain
MESGIHLGRNMRNIRVLLGIKQSAFAKSLGTTQQNVSKMESQKDVSMAKLEAAASVLGITVETIRDFNERVMFNNNIALEKDAGQIIHPIKEIMEYFKAELEKRDAVIEEQRAELEDYRAGRRKPTTTTRQGTKGELRSVAGKRVAGK